MKAVKESRFAPPSKTIPNTPAVEKKSDTQIRGIVRKKRDGSLAFLKKEGWILAAPVTEGYKAFFRRGSPGAWEWFDEAVTSDRERLSYLSFTYSSFALAAFERKDCEKAIGWAWLAGMFSGQSTVLHRESKIKSAAKGGKTKSRLDDVYMKLIRENPGKSVTALVEIMTGEDYEKSPRKTHENRLRILKKQIEP